MGWSRRLRSPQAVAFFRSPKQKRASLAANPFVLKNNGAQGRNRTTDTGIFSPLLYRLSYLGMLDLLGPVGRFREGAY